LTAIEIIIAYGMLILHRTDCVTLMAAHALDPGANPALV
jgi:hypothetical protein